MSKSQEKKLAAQKHNFERDEKQAYREHVKRYPQAEAIRLMSRSSRIPASVIAAAFFSGSFS